MIDFIKTMVLTLIVFSRILMERYSAEKDIVRQLVSEGRTHFIFLEDIKITDIETIKEKR